MDNDKAGDAINAFRAAEESLKQLVNDADVLTESASSIRDADQSVRALAEALGIAGKHWTEVATSLKDVAAEVQAAGKLLQKAEPQELMHAIDETTASVGEMRAQLSSTEETVASLGEQMTQLTARVDAIAESSTSLREALVAKMDLSQASLTQLQGDLKELTKDTESRDRTLENSIADTRKATLAAAKHNLFASSAAAMFALAAAILAVVM